MNNYMKSGVVLSSICAIIAIILSACNFLTAPIIAENDKKSTQAALFEVYPDAESFDAVDISLYPETPSTVTEAFSANDGGYVIKLKTSGYSNDFIILCGVSADGTVVGSKCLSSNETLGYEKTYGENLKDKNIENIDDVDTVSGATKTTSAYKNAVKDAIGAAMIFGGGSYDNRTEEEIKLDAALASAEGGFEDLFYAEEIADLTMVYRATNSSGYVFVFGEIYIGVDNDGVVSAIVTGIDGEGNVQTAEDSEYAAEINAALAKVLSDAAEEIDLSLYTGISNYIKSIKKNESGNYIVTVIANGYDAQSHYSTTKTPIKIMVSITSSGKIICAKTLEQNETDGVGSICADPDYYTQYNGKDSESYNDVDTVSGATVTTTAYKSAIGKVFAAVSIIESATEGGSSDE